MKSGTSASIPKLNENKNNIKKDIKGCWIEPFDLSDAKCSYTDVMKAPVKKRVPFIEILNQEESEIQNQKAFKKSSIAFIPNARIEEIFSCSENNKAGNQMNKGKQSMKSKINKTDQFTQEGKDSIQLISVVESLTISSRSTDKKSSEICKQKSYRLEINEQAIKKLLTLQSSKLQNEEFSFCSMVGKTKTGKSFLLNKLINSSKKVQTQTFSVNHTLASCTKGIWLSNQPISVSKNSQSKSLLILDTAGSGSYDSTQEIDYKLLTLSILLSDVLMYNSIGPIDQQMLNGMSLAVQISKLISQQQQKSNNIDKILTFPTLFWILRDFSLQLLTKQNKIISEQQYLEKCLNTQNHNKNSGSIKTKSKVNIRQAIKSLFTNRKCSTLVMPFDEQGQIRQQFRDGLDQVQKKLIKILNSQNQKKSSKKNQTKIQEFILKLRAFVDLLNTQDSNNSSKKGSFSFPKLQSVQESLNRVKLLHQFKKINEEYEKLFKKYQENIEKVQESVDSKQRYLIKVEKLRQKMENQINHTSAQFNQKIQKLLNLKNSLSVPKIQCLNSEVNNLIETSFNINLSQLQRDLNKSDNLFKVIKQNYEIQCDTLKFKFEQIQQKIIKSSQSFRSNHTEDEEKMLFAAKMVNEKIESFREINSISELKRAFEKTLKDLKSLFRESKEIKQMKKLQKQLEVEYLNHKVNLMESSNLQLSNQSNFDELSKLKTQGYESCTNCQKSFYIPYIIIPSSSLLKIKFLKTIVREIQREYTEDLENNISTSSLRNEICEVKKMKIQFIIEVELNNKKWFIRRKFKDFIELNNIISIMFTQQQDNMVYPTIQKASNYKNTYMTSMLKLSSMGTPNDLSEDKVRKTKQQLQTFLIQLNNLDYVRNSRIFQKFVKINKQYLDL